MSTNQPDKVKKNTIIGGTFGIVALVFMVFMVLSIFNVQAVGGWGAFYIYMLIALPSSYFGTYFFKKNDGTGRGSDKTLITIGGKKSSEEDKPEAEE